MPLLKTIILFHIMKVITTDDDSPLHLHFLHNSGKNSPTDGYITSKWALLVNVGTLNCLAEINM